MFIWLVKPKAALICTDLKSYLVRTCASLRDLREPSENQQKAPPPLSLHTVEVDTRISRPVGQFKIEYFQKQVSTLSSEEMAETFFFPASPYAGQ